MRLTLTLPLTALTVGSAVLAWGLLTAPAPAARPRAPTSGMAMLNAFRCQPGETRRIVVRGKEDGFAAAGEEPTVLREGRRDPHDLSFFRGSRYDQDRPDRAFTDSLRLPARTSSALFVIGLRPVASNANDVFTIGDLRPDLLGASGREAFGVELAKLERTPGWRRFGDFYAAELEDIAVSTPGSGTARSLLAQAGDTDGWIDVEVQDDTSVDFMGVAACTAPPAERGLTLAPAAGTPADVIFLSCRSSGPGQPVCDPYQGDTPCDRPLPLACFKPGEAPPPAGLAATGARRSWSGGRLALSSPAPASRFARLRDADRFCAARFGPGWRTAAFHDGVVEGVAGRGDAGGFAGRAWVDIADQPAATCWAR